MENSSDKECKAHPDVEPKLVLTPDIKHHGKWVCGECNKFLVWARKPKTSDELNIRQKQIRKAMVRSANLTDNELHKICSLYNVVHLTLGQIEMYKLLLHKCNITDSDDSDN